MQSIPLILTSFKVNVKLRNMKHIAVLTLLLFLLFFVKESEAKILPQAKNSGTSSALVSKNTSSTIGISPKLRADRRALIISFSNLQNTTSVSYLLTYKQGNGQQEGAGGALSLSGATAQSAEVLFGTCSKNVCRYHTGITDARLEVTYALKNGKKYIKRYKIKV